VIEYIKQHLLLIIIVIGTIAIFVLVVVMLLMDSPPPEVGTLSTEKTLSESILADPDTTEREKTAALTAIDNVFAYSNYGDTTQFLYGLLESSTENFKPNILKLISVLEKDQTGDLFSMLEVESNDYRVELAAAGGVPIATVFLRGKLTTNEFEAKEVTVKQRLVYQDPYWLLDNYELVLQ
jgi:hypothetical protein